MSERLEERAWRLSRGVDVPPGVEITARFAGGTVAGRSGVNRYRADYELDGQSLRLGVAASTMMAGPPEAMAAESAFLTLLGGVQGARVVDATLELLDRDGAPILWFEAAPAVEGITGRWDVRFVRRGDALVSSAATEPYLEFDADGRVTGSAGVNRVNGPARVDGDRVHLGPLMTTRMAGSPDAMDDEAALLSALDDVAAWRMDEDELVLVDADGETRVTLARTEA